MKKAVLKYRTLVLSDVHLGTLDCKVKEVNFVLKHTASEKLILNGDIIDGWSLSRKGGWTKQHTRFIRFVLKKLEKKDTEIVYLRGNHDDILSRFLPMRFGAMEVVEEHIHDGPQGKYLVIHGDVFDSVTQNHKFLAVLGDIGYQWLLKINRLYNHYRAWRGKEYFSLSKAIKARVKEAVNHISDFEDHLQELARKKGCAGIICGHIHTPADKMMGEIHYLNSGDWVESLTLLAEHFDGTWEVLDFQEIVARLHRLEEEKNVKIKSRIPGEDELAPLDLEDDEDDTVPLPNVDKGAGV